MVVCSNPALDWGCHLICGGRGMVVRMLGQLALFSVSGRDRSSGHRLGCQARAEVRAEFAAARRRGLKVRHEMKLARIELDRRDRARDAAAAAFLAAALVVPP